MAPRADYGLDAPIVQRNLALGGAVALLAVLGLRLADVTAPTPALLAGGASCLATAAVKYWSTQSLFCSI